MLGLSVKTYMVGPGQKDKRERERERESQRDTCNAYTFSHMALHSPSGIACPIITHACWSMARKKLQRRIACSSSSPPSIWRNCCGHRTPFSNTEKFNTRTQLTSDVAQISQVPEKRTASGSEGMRETYHARRSYTNNSWYFLCTYTPVAFPRDFTYHAVKQLWSIQVGMVRWDKSRRRILRPNEPCYKHVLSADVQCSWLWWESLSHSNRDNILKLTPR